MQMKPITSEPVRAWVYRLATAVFALLVLRGVLGSGEAAAWLEVVAATVGLGTAALASLHTSTKADPEGQE